MPAGRYSFVIEQGATTNIQIDWTDVNGSPINLSNFNARMQLRPSVESSDVYLQLSSSLDADGTGINLNGGTGLIPYESGSLAIYISAEKTKDLTFNEAYYDLEMERENVVIRLLEGRVKLSKNVTR